MKNITIEVAFATDKLQKIVLLEVPENTTITHAILQSDIFSYFADYFENPQQLLTDSNLAYGIWHKKINNPASYQLQDGDRIEIYRKLTQTPNQKRLAKVNASAT